MNTILTKSDSKTILVDFSAEWCDTCQTMESIFEDLAKEMADSLEFMHIDIDKHPQIAASFQIRSIPTFILLKNGNQIWRKAGLLTRKEFQKAIEEQL